MNNRTATFIDDAPLSLELNHFTTPHTQEKTNPTLNRGTSLRPKKGLKSGLKSRSQKITPLPHPMTSPYELETSVHAFHLGKSFLEAGEANQAIDPLTQAVHENPNLIVGWVALGKAYQALEVNEMAFKAFQSAHRLSPFDVSIIKALIDLAETLECWDEACTYYARYRKLSPLDQQDKSLLFAHAVALEQADCFEEAIDLYNQILQEDVDYFPAINNRAGCYMNMNEFEQAIAGFKHVLSLLPRFPRAILGLAIAQDLSGHASRAILTYRQYLHVQPEGRHAETVVERLGELQATH